MTNPESTKTCTKCNEEKPLSTFRNHKSTRDRLTTHCKSCLNAYTKAYYRANREQQSAYHKHYRQQNAESRSLYFQNYYEANFQAHQERMREWRAKNPGKQAEYSARRKARELEAETGTVDAQVIQQMLEDQGFVCAYCEVELSTEYHADHMLPLSRGGLHDWTNLAITCSTCNHRKRTKTVEEFLMWQIKGFKKAH